MSQKLLVQIIDLLKIILYNEYQAKVILRQML